jgi:SAM-dependent methyltransferase
MRQPPSDWWQTWFGPGYLALYDEYLAERTPIEIDQLEVLLGLRPPMRVLDLPCGQGRHAIELARRGYTVTAVDLSPYMLEIAEERAREAGVGIRFARGDMRQPLEGRRFDLVLNLFTSFGYFDVEADDRKVVLAAARMLDPAGRFVLEVINGERLMANFAEREWFTVGQAAVVERRSLDRRSRTMIVERSVTANGNEEVSVHRIRLYAASQLRELLATTGFQQVELYGDWDGSPVSPGSQRVLAVATKEKGGS